MKRALVLGCGAIAHELVAVFRANQWEHIDIQCLPAIWHNTPEKIVPGLREKLNEHATDYERIFIAYGDCGTGGKLDAFIDEQHDKGITHLERLPGDHCYAFFSGVEEFNRISGDELGTFYLTDYLAAHFERLILDDLGITKHPELLPMYFGNYTRLLYLSQQPTDELLEKARSAATQLQLTFEHIHTGLKPFDNALQGIRIVTD